MCNIMYINRLSKFAKIATNAAEEWLAGFCARLVSLFIKIIPRFNICSYRLLAKEVFVSIIITKVCQGKVATSHDCHNVFISDEA